MSKRKSAAEQVDQAFEALTRLQRKYGFPDIQDASEISDHWATDYTMKWSEVDQVRTAVNLIRKYLPEVPWKYAKK